MTDCIFCKIVKNEIKTTKVGETKRVLAFKDASPSADIHVLIVPKKHLETFLDLADPTLVEEMIQLAQKLISDLDLQPGYKLVFNGGRYQHVPHVHWHLLGGNLHREV